MPRSLPRRRLLATGTALAAGTVLGPPGAPARAAGGWPTTIHLPDGFQPEGIAIGPGPYAYFGSLANGSVYRAALATGRGRLITGSLGAGRQSIGLRTDRRGRLFVAGGPGTARVIATRSGAVLATYAAGDGRNFVNDVFLAPGAAFFTDSFRPQLYVLPFGRHGELPGPDGIRTLPLTGEWVQGPDFTANGIEPTPDRTALLVVNSYAGVLFRVDPRTGDARRVTHTGPPLVNGDGLLLLGRDLYVVQQAQNAVDVLRLNRSGTRGRAIARITDPRFQIPTTAAAFGDRIYLPNARFDVNPPLPTTTYTAVAVDRL
ncbi:superoxide dismutase [Streptomyces sp. CB02923]|uniref:superoxide dismutase n=1 Tax=Streptomyces sp. CB02923 TaxID=1718985 RepID=UPI00093F0690|nr:superoxide dismutase [Streptomyces sp. CB02923]OKH98398.1 superoxide dismutase [Streptomyces sp. CB02923]